MAGADKHEAHPLFGHNRPLIAAVLLLYTLGVSLAAYAYGQNSSLSSEQAFVTEHWKSAAEKYQEELQLLNGARPAADDCHHVVTRRVPPPPRRGGALSPLRHTQPSAPRS